MSRRIEIELTSARSDGTWTWRAAGAREPKGVLEGSLLPSDAKTGDVLKVEADFSVDGISVQSVVTDTRNRKEWNAVVSLVEFQRDLYGEDFETVTHLSNGSAVIVKG